MSKLSTEVHVNVRGKGHKLCIEHPKEEMVLVCKDCNDTLVCLHCVSTTHIGHQLIAVNLLVQDHLNFLQDWNIDTEETNIPRLSKRVDDAEVTIKEFQQGIQIHIGKVKDHGEYLKEIVEKSTNETVSELKDMEEKILQQFDKFKSDSVQERKQLEALLKESKEAIQSDNNILICDFTKEFNSQTRKELEFECGFNNLKFTKGFNPTSLIKVAFGKLEHGRNSSDVVTVTHEHANLSQNPTSSRPKDISMQVKSVTRTKQGSFWLCERGTPFIYRKSLHGPFTRREHKVTIDDISLHPVDDQLYYISNEFNSVHCMLDTTSMKAYKLFGADNPFCIAVTRNGNILVKTSMKPILTVYTSTGVIVETLTNMPVLIYHISVCRATGKLAFSCGDSGVSVWSGTDTLPLQPMFKYPTSGEKIPVHVHVNARDATFDNEGCLLIADMCNQKIHIIDATTGQFLKIVPIKNGLYPECITTHSNDSMLVCTSSPPQIVSIKYLD